MGRGSSGSKGSPGMAQERFNFFIERQHKRKSLANSKQVDEFASELDAMNPGDKIVSTTSRALGGGSITRTSETTYTKTKDGWKYTQKMNGVRVMDGVINSSRSLASSILVNARDENVEWKVKR